MRSYINLIKDHSLNEETLSTELISNQIRQGLIEGEGWKLLIDQNIISETTMGHIADFVFEGYISGHYPSWALELLESETNKDDVSEMVEIGEEEIAEDIGDITDHDGTEGEEITAHNGKINGENLPPPTDDYDRKA